MSEVLVVALLALGFYLFVRSFGGRRNSGGCRDCEACLRPRVQRMVIGATWGLIRAPFVAFLRTCPSCEHVVSKHQFRPDGAYID